MISSCCSKQTDGSQIRRMTGYSPDNTEEDSGMQSSMKDITPVEDQCSLDSEDDEEENNGDVDNENAWEDWEDIETNLVKCLFSEETFTNVEDALQHDAEQNSFDLIQYCIQVGVPFLSFFFGGYWQGGTRSSVIEEKKSREYGTCMNTSKRALRIIQINNAYKSPEYDINSEKTVVTRWSAM